MASRRRNTSTDRWQHKRLTLDDGQEVGWAVDPEPYAHVVAFFRRDTIEEFRLLREAGPRSEAGHPDAELPYGLRPEDRRCYRGK